MQDDFYRIKRLPPYVIAEVNAMRAAARARGDDIIDLGMGNPDLPPPPHVIDKLCEVAAKPDAHGYSAVQGHSRAAPRAERLLRAPLRASSSIPRAKLW
jgi:alanine-synthesizing transaminase